MRESLTRQAASLKAQLLSEGDSTLERLLVKNVVAVWMQLQHADAAVAQSPGASMKMLTFLQKRQLAAHQRFLAATRGLTTSRQLLSAAKGGVVGKKVPEKAEKSEDVATPMPSNGHVDGVTKTAVAGTTDESVKQRAPLSIFPPRSDVGCDDLLNNRISRYLEPVGPASES